MTQNEPNGGSEPDVRGILAAFAANRDAGLLFGPRVEDLRTAALQHVFQPERRPPFDLGALRDVAELSVLRYAALPAGQDQSELGWALQLCATLMIADPESVVPALREPADDFLRQSVRQDPRTWAFRAALIGEAYRSRGDGFAVGVLRRVVAILRMAISELDEPRQSSVPHDLAVTLAALSDVTGAPEPLAEAIEVLTGALARDPGDPEDSTLLGALYRKRYERSGAESDIQAAIAAQRAAVAGARDRAGLAQYQLNLAVALTARYRLLHDRADLDEAIAAMRAVVSATEESDPRRASRLSQLGSVLDMRYQSFGTRGDLDEAIECHRTAVECDPGAPSGLVNLSVALELRGTEADLDEAVDRMRQAISVTPEGNALLANRQMNLVTMLYHRYERRADRADLDAARALAARRQGGDLEWITLIARASRYQWDADGAASDLAEGINLLERGLASAPGADRQVVLASALSELAGLLRRRFQVTDDRADIDTAIRHSRTAIRLFPSDQLPRRTEESNLGRLLQVRYERYGATADIDNAIEITRAAAAAARDDQARVGRLSDLGHALHLRFDRTGSLADLNEAVAVNRAALAGQGTPEQRIITNLTVSLYARYRQLGHLDDLDEAIALLRPCLEEPWRDAVLHTRALSNMGIYLHERFEERQDQADLDEAVSFARAALEAAGTESDQGRCLNTLGTTLITRFTAAGDRADLAETIDLLRLALSVTAKDAPFWPSMASNLALTLLLEAEQDANPAILSEALSLLSRSLELFGPHSVLRFRALLNKARALELRFQAEQDAADRREAVVTLADAAATVGAPARERLSAAVRAASLAAEMEDWDAAMEQGAVAVRLLPLAAWRGSLRSHRESQLASVQGIAGFAAACAIAADRPDRAVELLEEGRTVLWSQLLEQRSDLAALRDVAPELADRLQLIGRRLEQSESASAGGDETGSDERIRLAHDWDVAVAEVRRLDGWRDFLVSPSFDRVRSAVPEGTVVMLNFSSVRCDALLVDHSGVLPVPLPQLSADEVIARTNEYLAIVAEIASATGSDAVTWVDANQRMLRLLEWLWDDAVSTIVSALGPAHAVRRLWWCPTGLLAMLPIHAAGRHDPEDPDRASLLESTISSYTPTIRALQRAHDAPFWSGPASCLIVAMPRTPGLPPLPGARREARLVAQRFPGHRTMRASTRATRAAVLAALRDHAFAHFACHGRQTHENPAESGLILHDGLLTVGDLSGSRLRLELAFLSACQTATGTAVLPDESIHLTAALQLAGCRQVIGTLWYIADGPAAEFADAVYEGLAGPGGLDVTATARTVQRSVALMRDALPLQPLLWACYVHVGT